MSLSKTLMTPFRVGLVVIVGIIAFFVILSFLGKQKYSDNATYRVTATFKDASGLGPKSRVQIAGIEVGTVEKIDLTSDARARATLLIKNEIRLREDARITKRSASLLGDFLLDVYPGSEDQPLLPPGSEIQNVVNAGGVEDVFASLGEVTRDIQKVTRSLTEMLSSNEGAGSIKDVIKSMGEVAEGLNRTVASAGGRLDNILGDVEALSSDLRGLAAGQQRTIADILSNLRSFLEQASQVLVTINKIVGTGEGELKDSVASVRETLDQLQGTLKGATGMVQNLDGTVTDARRLIAAVDRGEGTIGKLLKDDAVAVKLEKTVTDMNGLLGPIVDLQTHVQIREELHGLTGGKVAGKATVQVKLVPRPDKFYGIEVVTEPRGNRTREVVSTTRNDAGDPVVTTTETTTDDVKFSAYFGKRFGPAALRIGLIESTGGVGGDLMLLKDRLRVTVDAFDWSNPHTRFPRLRTSAQLTFLDHLYLGVGLDDALNSSLRGADGQVLQEGRELFVAGGLQFNDADLKTILTIVGVPSTGQ